MKEIIDVVSNAEKLRYKLEAEEDAKRIYKTEIYEAKQEGEALGIQTGRTQGFEEGIKEDKLESVKSQLNIVIKTKNFSFDSKFISEITGLSEVEIDNII